MSVTRAARGVPAVLLAGACAVTCLTSGCAPKEGEGPPVGVSSKGDLPLPMSDKATSYAFDPIDARQVSSTANHGKPTVIVFVTTGDIVGQAQVSFLVHMAKNDGDRINYAVVALHPRKELVLVEAWRTTLGVEFPVALADAAATGATGPFGEIPAVPTVIVLDRDSHIRWKHTGLAKNDEIRGHMQGL